MPTYVPDRLKDSTGHGMKAKRTKTNTPYSRRHVVSQSCPSRFSGYSLASVVMRPDPQVAQVLSPEIVRTADPPQVHVDPRDGCCNQVQYGSQVTGRAFVLAVVL